MRHSIRFDSTFVCALLIASASGCARHPNYPPAAEAELAEPAPLPPTPEQAKARADQWAREDAESERHSAERARRKQQEAATRDAAESRSRAEVEAHPFVFAGVLQAGREGCSSNVSLKFHDIKSLTSDCPACRCEYATRHTGEGTTWTANCSSDGLGALDRKLFVTARKHAAVGPSVLPATLEDAKGAGPSAGSCTYVGHLTDRTGAWKRLEAENEATGASDTPANETASHGGEVH